MWSGRCQLKTWDTAMHLLKWPKLKMAILSVDKFVHKFKLSYVVGASIHWYKQYEHSLTVPTKAILQNHAILPLRIYLTDRYLFVTKEHAKESSQQHYS